MKFKLRYGLVVAGGVLVAATLAYIGMDWRVKARCDLYRTEGLQALEQGQFALAVEKLGHRLSQSSCGVGDADALFKFARARSRVPEPGASHIVESVAALKNAVIAKPDFVDAWRELALAWLGMGQPARAVDASRRALALNPADHHAQRLLLTGLLATGRESEALEFSNQTLEHEPRRWWLHLARLSAVSTAAATNGLQPTDTSALSTDQQLLVESYAAILRGQDDVARRRLALASKTENHDPLFLETLVNLMTGIELHAAALEMLHRHRAQLSGKMRTTYVELAWQGERVEWIIDYLGESPLNIGHEPGLILVRAMAARVAGLSGLAIQEATAGRELIESEANRRWRRLVAAVEDQTADPERAEAAEQVLEIEPRNAVVLQLLAESWMRLGEPRRTAIIAAHTMQLARGWALPARTRAQALLRSGRPLAALAAAREATRRSPTDPRSGLTLARAWAQALGDGDEQGARDLLKLVSALESRANLKRSDALDPIRMIANTRLATRMEKAGSDYGRIEELRGGTPGDSDSARFSQVSRSAPEDAGQTSPPTELVTTAEARRCGGKSEGDDRAACWRLLVKSHPDDLNAHLLALASATFGGDAELQIEIVDRLTNLTPASSSLRRLARARLLLTSEFTEKKAAEAALLLRHVLQRVPDQPDAHLLMAVALAHLRDIPAVGAHLLEAVKADSRRSTEALWLSLHLAQEVIKVEPTTLISWWESLTWLEYESITEPWLTGAWLPGQHRATEDGRGRRSLLARLGVLAAFAESRPDAQLAEAVYRRILQLDPGAHVAINNLAMILSSKQESLDEALKFARQALELKPLSADYQDTLGVVKRARNVAQEVPSQEGGRG